MPERSDLILILGASGMLGAALRCAFSGYKVIATHFSASSGDTVHFDARLDPEPWIDKLPQQPTMAIVALGNTRIDDCAKWPSLTAEVNVTGVCRVLDCLGRRGIYTLFVSSDAVFDGSQANSSEAMQVHPVLEYGRQKRAVERHLETKGDMWSIARLPKLLCIQRARNSLLHQWIDALGQSDPILCATDNFFSPMAVDDAALVLREMTLCRAQGLFHVAGPSRIARRELLDSLTEQYRRFAPVRASIQPCELKDIPVFEQRPLDTSMDTGRIQALLAFRPRDHQQIVRQAVERVFLPENEDPAVQFTDSSPKILTAQVPTPWLSP